VALAATYVPQGAIEVGIGQAVARGADLPELAREFAGQVAALGGNFGLIDRIETRFEWVSSRQSYTYACGTSQQPRTCYGYRTVTNEVATTQMVGRAYHVPGLALPAATTDGGGGR
jgi:hypothetical protein